MERTKQKSKKGKSNLYTDKEKSSSFIADVKTFKENLKIREILRTVKMNSSMRIKAPRGSKVMQNKDFNENEDIFENKTNDEDGENPPSATNTILNTEIDDYVVLEEPHLNNEVVSNENMVETELLSSEYDETDIDTSVILKSRSVSEGLEECAEVNDDTIDSSTDLPSPIDSSGVRSRDRKLSLDQTMLTRREGLSQSEVDLNLIGKLPLERKSSFFKKKMDSFLKNTTEIFKRQSLGKSIPQSSSIQRSGSVCSRMSVSLQSLNENSIYSGEYDNEPMDKYHNQEGSVTSLHSSVAARSNSSLSGDVNDRPPLSQESLTGSQGLVDSEALPETPTSISGMPQSYLQEPHLNTRAISMSSGLDTATGQRRRKTSRTNRVSWLASESLTDYFRRLIPDEKGLDTQENLDTVPVNKFGLRTDSKGRRLSYVRAVSGEDPSLPSSRTQDSSLRRKKIPENEGHRMEVETMLAAFSTNGIPPLFGYTAWQISPEANEYLDMLDSLEAIEHHFPFAKGKGDVDRQEILRELIYTESLHIRHLKVFVRVYIAAAHSLQSSGALSNMNTSVLFLNMPDLLNASIQFWEKAIFPMVHDALKNKTTFDAAKMIPGLSEFAVIFDPFEEYMHNQQAAVKYLRHLVTEAEFNTFVTWCDHQADNRLQLGDMLVKPMQRITKYPLIIERLIRYTFEEDTKRELIDVESNARAFISSVNRNCRQKEEIDILDSLKIEPYEPDFKGDEEMQRAYAVFSVINLFQPMVECGPSMMRCLVHEGDLRYKDFQKEFDAHVLLFTDMMLICKKLAKKPKNAVHWKMQRPKILLHRIVPHARNAKTAPLIYVIQDEHGTAKGVFQLSELSKDPNPAQTLKLWETKVYEAMMSYTLTKWYNKYSVKDASIVERDFNDEIFKKEKAKVCAIERNARNRVAAMLFPNKNLEYPESGREYESPLSGFERDRGPMQLHTVCETGLQSFNAWQARAPNFRRKNKNQSTNTDQYFSFSGSSYEDPASLSLQQSGSSVEHYMLDDHNYSPAITVNCVSDTDCSPISRSQRHSPPILVIQQSSPNLSPGPRSASAGAGSDNTLRVASPCHTKVHSLPDINAALSHVTEPVRVKPLTASEMLYRSHYELLHRNRLASQQQLSPENRGHSFPPTSPARSLKREQAICETNPHPPLERSKNLSQSFQQKVSGGKSRQSKPGPSSPRASTSGGKGKPKSLFQRRSKDSAMSASPERAQGEPIDDTEYDADDDRSRRSSKSTKGDKIRQRLESCILEDLNNITAEEQDSSENAVLIPGGKLERKKKDKG